jgi:Flp pilus assembly protein TadG
MSKDRLKLRVKDHRRRAVAATELAILLPLLIAICLTSVDFGRFAYAYIAIGNAGRVGAEFLATRDYTQSNSAVRQSAMRLAVRDDLSTAGGIIPDAAMIS